MSLFLSEPGRKEYDKCKRVKSIYSVCRWAKIIPKAKPQHAGMRARKKREGQEGMERKEPSQFYLNS